MVIRDSKGYGYSDQSLIIVLPMTNISNWLIIYSLKNFMLEFSKVWYSTLEHDWKTNIVLMHFLQNISSSF